MKTQTVGITYEMRNFPPAMKDINFAEMSAETIANAILEGMNGVESVFKIRGGEVYTSVAPIEKVSEKRYAYYYEKHMAPLVDRKSFEVTNEIGKYYRALFGERKSLSSLLPKKPKIVCVV